MIARRIFPLVLQLKKRMDIDKRKVAMSCLWRLRLPIHGVTDGGGIDLLLRTTQMRNFVVRIRDGNQNKTDSPARKYFDVWSIGEIILH